MAYLTKVTSKGQLTLPKEIRKVLALNRNSYLAVDEVGEYILMKKISANPDEITDIFQEHVRERKVTKEELIKTLTDIRRKNGNKGND
ncbi:MAG: hypothetical protein CVT88_06040 [Candidatus Altiarchaeales archaeon HGW-Altiarchaeales-1]|nr:MAG: hypothetical protein CVT88_06040 [Candidatus Altiarchaeales archaeon HGW-Altiarchaeales-1]